MSTVAALWDFKVLSKTWDQEATAWEAMRSLPEDLRCALQDFDRKANRRRTMWTWDRLLRTIALDQAIYQYARQLSDPWSSFEEVARARKRDGDPVWASDVERIYRIYHVQEGALRSRGVRLSPAAEKIARAEGLEVVSGRLTMDEPLLPELRGRHVDGQSRPTELPDTEALPVVFHWLHHALRNLLRYRNGHEPLPWVPDCQEPCEKARNNLLPR